MSRLPTPIPVPVPVPIPVPVPVPIAVRVRGATIDIDVDRYQQVSALTMHYLVERRKERAARVGDHLVLAHKHGLADIEEVKTLQEVM